MRALILFIAISAFAEPKPIPPERHEAVSRVMLKAAMATINLLSMREQTTVNMEQLRAAEQERTAANHTLSVMLEAYRKEFEAPGCTINLEKKWECPKKETTNASNDKSSDHR